jgi:hypothetical protein
MARAAQPRTTTGRKRSSRKAPPELRGIAPEECRLESIPGAVTEVTRRIEAEGGVVLAAYRDPLGSSPLLLAALPIDRIEPTPFQRDLSEMHSKRLAGVIERTGLYLDPVIAVMAPDGGFWTPNGRHRLEAMRRLGAKAITALVVPQREIAWQILALNRTRKVEGSLDGLGVVPVLGRDEVLPRHGEQRRLDTLGFEQALGLEPAHLPSALAGVLRRALRGRLGWRDDPSGHVACSCSVQAVWPKRARRS